ncbi:ABC transporter F family member 5 [Chlorella sorokiniana]|uniref:ABC transporter F family member 5 n=1 Tax=Chlorella sorokiniana TaxID=3076 RepID=A0A2P6TGG7_CHLSO|nr:ABC transporter F family member 5 [Chlorella sorokiniana]|eukprot:PRW33209.1 ABC transporter F family member 5 [Chlorella sorokiniana]
MPLALSSPATLGGQAAAQRTQTGLSAFPRLQHQLQARHQQHAALPRGGGRQLDGCRIVARAAAPEKAEKASAATQSTDLAGKGRAGGSGIGSGIKLENIAITFKNQQVLRDISWDVKKGERVGLVGVNGAGKTTQLQIIIGALTPDSGEVIKAKEDMRIAYLTQEFDVDPRRTVREEFMSAFADQVTNSMRQEEIQKELESVGEDMDRMSELLDELQELTSQAQDLDVALIDKKIDQMMPELGFGPDDNDRLVASYSGGWQMRMCLGKILLKDPDLLLLDEPTNHLDLDAIEWLEGYLKKQEIPMVIVSHDREFLDQLCTKIVETERGVSATYKGNYTEYVKQKEVASAQQWVAWEKQQKEISRQEEMMRRLSGGANSGRASTAEKTLEKLKAEGTYVEKPFVPKKRPFKFPPVENMGQVAVRIEELTHGYNGDKLFQDADLVIERGERVAIIGPNGAGKSTLLRLLMGREEPQEGTVELGQYGIVPNYFEQNQAQALDPRLTVLETLVRAAPDAKLNDIKALLGKMLFSGAGMEKKVEWLSGGEKARLALAKFMLTQGTLLVLDEPTNHLDIPSKETLEEAVSTFEGSVIAVSHDRYFLRRIATRIVTVDSGKLVDYQGDYELFLEQNEEEAEKMEAKEEKQREIEKSQIKAKSKMSKAEKAKAKKDKAKAFNQGPSAAGKAPKNAKRWN